MNQDTVCFDNEKNYKFFTEMLKNDTTEIKYDPSKKVSEAKFYTHFSMNEREQCSTLNEWFKFIS